jgi:hypothetical protein
VTALLPQRPVSVTIVLHAEDLEQAADQLVGIASQLPQLALSRAQATSDAHWSLTVERHPDGLTGSDYLAATQAWLSEQSTDFPASGATTP